MTLYFAINEFSCPEIVFSKLPWHPPNGFITSILAMALIFSIFSVIIICTCSCLSFMRLRQIKITHMILRETLHSTYLVIRELSQKRSLKDVFWQLYLILRELVQKMTWMLTKASCVSLLSLTTLPSSILTQAFASEVFHLIQTLHSRSVIIQQLGKFATASLYCQENLPFQFILLGQQWVQQNQLWWEWSFFVLLTTMAKNIFYLDPCKLHAYIAYQSSINLSSQQTICQWEWIL